MKDQNPSAQDLRELHELWFANHQGWPGKEQGNVWFAGGKDMDAVLKERFTALADRAATGKLDHCAKEDRLAAALIVALDQLPRNIYRGTAQAFVSDANAMALSQNLLASGRFDKLWPVERLFVLMPFQHVEDLVLQEESIVLFERLAQSAPNEHREFLEGTVEHAQIHHDIIAKFGRFPHRNQALGRAATPEEEAWLAEGGHTFGQ